MNKWPKVSVVISNYNGLKLNLLEESLSSIFKNDYPNLQVILVDNASSDGSIKFAKKRFPKLKIVQNPVNMYSQGMNLGIKSSQGQYVAFFNNDVVVREGYFQKFIRFLEKNQDIALAQSKLISYFDHKIIDSAGETMDSFGTPVTIGAGSNVKYFSNQTAVLSVSGSCNILRRSAVLKIGFFDKDYGIGYEDLDLALRAWMRGYRVVYFPSVSAFHKRGATDLSPMVRINVRWHFNKNRIATLIKNYPNAFLLKNLPVTILIYVLAGAWEIFIKGNLRLGLTRFSSLGWVLLNLAEILKKRKQVQSASQEAGKKKILQLLHKKTLLKGFLMFVKVK